MLNLPTIAYGAWTARSVSVPAVMNQMVTRELRTFWQRKTSISAIFSWPSVKFSETKHQTQLHWAVWAIYNGLPCPYKVKLDRPIAYLPCIYNTDRREADPSARGIKYPNMERYCTETLNKYLFIYSIEWYLMQTTHYLSISKHEMVFHIEWLLPLFLNDSFFL